MRFTGSRGNFANEIENYLTENEILRIKILNLSILNSESSNQLNQKRSNVSTYENLFDVISAEVVRP